MTTVDIINEGVDTTSVVKLFAQHTCVFRPVWRASPDPHKTHDSDTNTQRATLLEMQLPRYQISLTMTISQCVAFEMLDEAKS